MEDGRWKMEEGRRQKAERRKKKEERVKKHDNNREFKHYVFPAQAGIYN
jgi:hypothetical protein